ncbi:MAG: MFS transporter [Anaerolineaceae bacterium]|nr:MFS transporter [Anaerolineaceae bacterium]
MKHKHNGMRTFVIIWLGQMVSLIGTAMTRFALLIWTYQQTEQATAVALLGFFSFVPFVLVSPLAGIVADRYDRRWVMILADMGAGFMTIGLLILHQQDALQIWHLYLAQAVASFFEAFQVPAYTAVTSTLVDKSQYGRINGMRSTASAAADIIAPLSAGLVVTLIGIGGGMIVDVVTFCIAMLALFIVQLPRSDKPIATEDSEPFWQEVTAGLRFITARRGLLGLLITYVGINLFAALTYFAILPPMILARSGGSELALASVQGMLGGAALVGGLVMSVWGGPRRKIHGALGFTAVSFLLGDFLFGVGRTLPVWLLAAAVSSFFIPLLVGSYRAIWQVKVPLAMQGRVFAVQGALQTAMMPLGYLLAGPLADHLLEPAMMPNGALASALGWLVGTGPGAGMGLMFVATAVLGCLMSLSGYLLPDVREVEVRLPDYDLVGEVI